ncbi:hypothetical protein [Roseomonas indoligenes]|uniref:Uncharacterized protein n=1 Tax=Roseomonas indoligenes TaxID=2820811 RepID=A0A940N0G8_9PROT|nr:hypothetical protein [Pararoseomonas indoligenes]MBP0495606.1 hypothetical protein [Pararoseomonas indoligenes]
MSPPMSSDAPLIAVFSDDETALAAVAETRAELLRTPSPGVVLLRPVQGLRERLYAAGAAVVVP